MSVDAKIGVLVDVSETRFPVVVILQVDDTVGQIKLNAIGARDLYEKLAAVVAEQPNRRTSMKKDAKAQLLHEWDVGKERFRLVGKADSTPGYIDKLIIDQLRADSMGEPVWDTRHQVNVARGADLRSEALLLSCLLSLLPPR